MYAHYVSIIRTHTICIYYTLTLCAYYIRTHTICVYIHTRYILYKYAIYINIHIRADSLLYARFLQLSHQILQVSEMLGHILEKVFRLCGGHVKVATVACNIKSRIWATSQLINFWTGYCFGESISRRRRCIARGPESANITTYLVSSFSNSKIINSQILKK